MRIRILPLFGIALVFSCGEGPVDRSTVQPVVPAPTPTVTAAREPGPLATRVEAQQSFDRARAALLRKDYRESVEQITEAVAFMRSHAAESQIGAVAALQGAAKELEVLAERLTKGEPPTIRTLDRVFANANRAEGQHHLARAVGSSASGDRRSVGEEILMVVDHLERSLRYLRQPNDPRSARAFSEARALATRIHAGSIPSRAEIKAVMAPLDAELRRLCSAIDREAEACAIDQAR